MLQLALIGYFLAEVRLRVPFRYKQSRILTCLGPTSFIEGALLISLAIPSGCARHSEPALPRVCVGAHYNEFNFWVGWWDVVDMDTGKRVAQADVESVLNQCAVLEDYRADDGGRGMSLSSWDAGHKLWRQYWVSDKGATVIIEGISNDGSMTLTGTEDNPQANYLIRGVWKPVGKNVRETAIRSVDGGRTWKPWFDLEFKPAHSSKEIDR